MAQSLMSVTHLLTVDWHSIQLQLLESALSASALFTESMLEANIAADIQLLVVSTYVL